MKENTLLDRIQSRKTYKELMNMGLMLVSTERKIKNGTFEFEINTHYLIDKYVRNPMAGRNSRPLTYEPNVSPWVIWITPQGGIMQGHKANGGGYSSVGEKITSLSYATDKELDDALKIIKKAWKERIAKMRIWGWTVFDSEEDRHNHRGFIAGKKFGF